MLKWFQLFMALGILSLLLAPAEGNAATKKSCGCLFEIDGRCFSKPCDDDNFLGPTWAYVGKPTDVFKIPTDIGGGGSELPTGPIFATGYSELTTLGSEEQGYGLYSYAIVTSNTPRTVAFMKALFKSIDSIAVVGGKKWNLNILYIPVIASKKKEFVEIKKSLAGQAEKLAEKYMQSFYDKKMANDILYHICENAEGKVRDLCVKSDTSEGPFLFTYKKRVTASPKVPPPYLMVDLRHPMHENAFPTILSRYKEQVQSDNYADDTRINTFGNRLLSIVLTAADWTDLLTRDIGTIVHAVGLTSTNKN